MSQPPSPPQVVPTRSGHTSRARMLLVLLALALHLPGLAGPLPDGQPGNCAAMFLIMSRNWEQVGLLASAGVPLVNVVPPTAAEELVPYSHHPPGLPLLVWAATRLPLAAETAARLLALALSLASALLLHDLARRVLGARAALAAGLLFLVLPSGVLLGTLVNYETLALPALIGLTRALVVPGARVWPWALLAAGADWIALTPALLLLPFGQRRACLKALAVGGSAAFAALLHGRLLTTSSTAETLGQALAATFLSPQFDAGAWSRAGLGFLGTQFGWCLPAGLLLLLRPPRAAQTTLLLLLGTGLTNVVLFAGHASTHEHFWLLLSPFVALAAGALAFPGPQRSARTGCVVFLALGLAGWAVAFDALSAPPSLLQSQRAQAFAQVTDAQSVFVTPGGAPLVFLYGATRHVVPFSVSDGDVAVTQADAYADRVGLHADDRQVFVHQDDLLPDWVASLEHLDSRGPYRFFRLPAR